AEHEKKKAELQAALSAYKTNELPANQEKWENDIKLPQLRALPAAVSAILLLEPKKRTDKQHEELRAYYAKNDKRLTELTKAITDHDRTAPQLSKAQTLALGAARKTHVMIRGDFLRPGVEVQPGTPGVLPPLHARDGGKPTRLDLAGWLVDPANPLTARVTVNWMWQKYFGRGLVATLEDVGTQVEKPSHP